MRRRITYANVASTLALFLAMSGGAWAANHYLLTSTKQISPKVLKKLKGNTGKTGAAGATGKEGPQGKEGTAGKEGPRGLGVGPAGGTTSGQSCTLSTSESFCLPSGSSTTFTPASDAQCLIHVASQIAGLESGKPTTNGPYFRIAWSENGGAPKNDTEHGYYFEGTDGAYSTPQERTRLISVKAGVTYVFGAYYGSVEGEWLAKQATYIVTYTCFT